MEFSIITVIVGVVIGAAVQWSYDGVKSTCTFFRRKVSYAKKLEDNRTNLLCELEFLRRQRTDTERMVQRLGMHNMASYVPWIDEVAVIMAEADSLLEKYTRVGKSCIFGRSKLSKKMLKKHEEVRELQRRGRHLFNIATSHMLFENRMSCMYRFFNFLRAMAGFV